MKITALMENTTSLPGILTEHGLSLFIETGNRKILFDTGRISAFAENAITLGVDLSSADTAVVSHGHYDHGGGLAKFLSVNGTAPVYISRYAFDTHLSGEVKDISLDKTLMSDGRLVYTGNFAAIGDGLELYSCNDRRREHETDTYGLNTVRDGKIIPEDFRHEQYLLIREGQKRVLISGCSHKGILNIVEWFKPDVLIGGFHFMKLDPEGNGKAVLDEAAEYLKKQNTVYWTCHCTGTAQYDYLKPQMKEQLNYLSAGQKLTV